MASGVDADTSAGGGVFDLGDAGSAMCSLSGPKGGYHLSWCWVDHGMPVFYYDWDSLVAISHRPDKSSCVGVRPDVDLVD